MADGPQIGTAYLRIAGDFSQVNSQAVAMFNSSKWSKLGKVAGVALGAGVVAGGAAKALYDIGAEFDAVTDKIRTQTGATGKELGKLEGSFKKVVSTVPTDFGAAADAVAGLHQRLDLTGKPLTELARQITALSEVTGTDVKDNVVAITRLFGDWSVKTERQHGTLDKLYRLTQTTGIGFRDLSELMVQFGSPLRQLGFSFDESAVMFARFEKEGVNMQTVMPGLRMALKNIAVPSDELAKSFKRLGIDTRDPHDALLQLFDVMSSDKISEADQTLLSSQVFGGRAWADMKAAIEEGRFEFDDLIKGMRRGKDTISDSERSTRDFSEQWQLFTNRLKVFVEPIATKVFQLVGDGMKALNRLDFGKAIDAMKDFWNKAGLLRDIVKRVGEFIVDRFGAMVDLVKSSVKLISSILTGDFGAAWDAVKGIFKGGVRLALAPLKAGISLFRDVAGRIGDVLASAFGGAWDKIKGIFEGGRDALVSIINWIISNVINRIPGVELGTIGTSGGGGGHETGTGASPNAEHHFSGGKITAPMAIVGEEAPRHPEFVLATNPAYRKRNLGLWHQAGQMLGVPGFAQGGIHGTSAFGAAADAATGVVQAPSHFINMLDDAPFDKLPGFMSGTADYVKDRFSDFIRDKVQSVADAVTGPMTSSLAVKGPAGIGNYAGIPMANWVIDSLKFAASKGVAPRPTSGYRSHAENVAQGRFYHSEHEGTQYPHGAVDFGGYDTGLAEKMAVVNATRDFKYPLLAPIGFHDDGHASGTGHFRGGIIGKAAGHFVQAFKDGGVIGRAIPAVLQKYNHLWAAHVSPDYGGPTMPYEKVAQLAEYFGVPGWAAAQVTMGESPGSGGARPGAVGDDTLVGGDSKGWGLWQITDHGHSGMDPLVNRLGGYPAMLNPIANAIVMSKMYHSRGWSPWVGTSHLTDPGKHWQGDMGELARAGADGAAGGSRGGGPSPDQSTPVKPASYTEGMALPYAYNPASGLSKQVREQLKMYRGQIGKLDEQISVQETLDAFSTSEMGSELGPGERVGQVNMNKKLLLDLIGLSWWLKIGLREKRLKPSVASRIKADLDDLEGITGQGGRILDVRAKIDELNGSALSGTAAGGMTINDLLEFAQAVRYGAFDQNLKTFHTGGIVDGAPGTQEVLAKLQTGEGVIDRDTMRSGLGGGGPYEMEVVNWEEGKVLIRRTADKAIDTRDRSTRGRMRAGVN